MKKIATTTQEEEKEEHRKIRNAMNKLFVKLDALSNFHFVPKPVAPDIRIVNNLPTLVVEEVQPSTMSTSQLLAPEEIQAKKKEELKGATEATKTDKKRSRRKKKLRQKAKAHHQKDKVEMEKKKEKVTTTGKGNSSAAFFNKLQDTVKADVSAKKLEGKDTKKRAKPSGSSMNAKRFKL